MLRKTCLVGLRRTASECGWVGGCRDRAQGDFWDPLCPSTSTGPWKDRFSVRPYSLSLGRQASLSVAWAAAGALVAVSRSRIDGADPRGVGRTIIPRIVGRSSLLVEGGKGGGAPGCRGCELGGWVGRQRPLNSKRKAPSSRKSVPAALAKLLPPAGGHEPWEQGVPVYKGTY